MLVNCYSSGNIKGTYLGGIMGAISGDYPAKCINCYYLKSDTVNNSVGGIGITEVTQDLIDSLNGYILNNEEGYVTTDWKTWALDENGNPTLVKRKET